MLDQNTFIETVQSVAEIIRTSAEPIGRDEIMSYFKDMELNKAQEDMVFEFLITPHEQENESAGDYEDESQDELHVCFYSPRPLLIASVKAFNASCSSAPSQTSSISSPHFTHAPSTLNTLFAFAVPPSKVNVIAELYFIASLHNIPAGRK